MGPGNDHGQERDGHRMSKLIVPAVYVQHERYLVKRLRFSCHHDALVVKFRLPFMRKGLPQTRLQQVVAWVGKEYLAIKVSEPQIGSLKMVINKGFPGCLIRNRYLNTCEFTGARIAVLSSRQLPNPW